MNFTAIDFETANEMMSSPCALGLAVVEGGLVVERRSWLIRPKELRISAFNTRIHGISVDDVRNEPEFSDLWFLIRGYLDGRDVIAHNAPFDMGVLDSTLRLYDIPFPVFDYSCTVAISRQVWPRPEVENHKLNTMAGHLDVEFKHHDASEDAYASAIIAIEAAKRLGADSFDGMLDKLHMKKHCFTDKERTR